MDHAVQSGQRDQAVTLADRLLEELSKHYRAMRPLRLKSAPQVGAAMADEAFAVIGEVVRLTTGSTPAGCPSDLGTRVQELLVHEAAAMVALGSQP